MSDFENPYAQQDPQPNPYAAAVVSTVHPEMGSESELAVVILAVVGAMFLS